ncbi:MAG TPA: SDR family oxidoreductase [Opitutaceae bacterium]|jgi:3-dehydrosphinganine reductase|nr:SDR family oxidoreductase [Opitutaceae bacterium]
MTLKDSHVLVTGGSSGIGLAIAQRCAAAGSRVSLVARDAGKLAAARAAILAREPGAKVQVAEADVSSEAQVASAFASVQASNGPVDILVTSAGVATPGHFGGIASSVFERSMQVNYLGTVYATKAVLGGMRERRRGAVVMVSSGAGLIGLFGYTAYSPTKFAVRGFAESLRGEVKADGVQVSIVYPPDTDTPQLAEENRTKPAETKAITSGAGLWTADDVARLTLEGVACGRFAITPGAQLTALYWLQGLLFPILQWRFDGIAARVRRERAP